MASAVEQLVNNYNTSSPVSFHDYYNAYGRDNRPGWTNDVSPYGFGGKFQNFLFGTTDSARQAYENYLGEYEYRRNLKATNAQNQLTFAREDTQIQRLMEDYKKAGLNPYMLLSGGNLSSGVVSSQASAPSYKRSSYKSNSKGKGSSVVTSAIKALAMIALLGG